MSFESKSSIVFVEFSGQMERNKERQRTAKNAVLKITISAWETNPNDRWNEPYKGTYKVQNRTRRN